MTGCTSDSLLPALLLAGYGPSATSLVPDPLLHTPQSSAHPSKAQSSGLFLILWSQRSRAELESRVDALPTAGSLTGPHSSFAGASHPLFPFKDGGVTGGYSDHRQGHMSSLTEDHGRWVDGSTLGWAG